MPSWRLLGEGKHFSTRGRIAMTNDSEQSVDQPKGEQQTAVSGPAPRVPGWVPRWMGERERAALIIALGLVASAFILIFGAKAF